MILTLRIGSVTRNWIYLSGFCPGLLWESLVETTTTIRVKGTIMRYRKTVDTWEVQTNHGYGWDTETTEYTLQSARRQMRDYLEAAMGRWNTRIVYKRIRKSDLTPQELLDITQCYFEQVKEDKQERQERRLVRKQQA